MAKEFEADHIFSLASQTSGPSSLGVHGPSPDCGHLSGTTSAPADRLRPQSIDQVRCSPWWPAPAPAPALSPLVACTCTCAGSCLSRVVHSRAGMARAGPLLAAACALVGSACGAGSRLTRGVKPSSIDAYPTAAGGTWACLGNKAKVVRSPRGIGPCGQRSSLSVLGLLILSCDADQSRVYQRRVLRLSRRQRRAGKRCL